MKKVLGIFIIIVMGCISYYLYGFKEPLPDDSILHPTQTMQIKNSKPAESHKKVLSFRNKKLCSIVAQNTGTALEDVLVLGYLADIDKEKKSWAFVKNGIPVDIESFKSKIAFIKGQEYRICNKKSGKYHLLTCKYGIKTSNYEILPLKNIKNYQPCGFCIKNHNAKNKSSTAVSQKKITSLPRPSMRFSSDGIKILLSDHTTTLKPSKSCNSYMCQELLSQINSAQSTIDMALYGYEAVPAIDNALNEALARGVKIRLVYDLNSKSNNYYKDTLPLVKRLPDSVSDYGISGLMHNKFFIFDSKIVMTGSSNLSFTDMSGFNSNSVVLLKSAEAAKIYEYEFNQMYSGKFHRLKEAVPLNRHLIIGNSKVAVYFSPKDNVANKVLIPLINSAQKYIYIPSFIITERGITDALIAAKSRGVDVKIIIDAVHGRSNSTKHRILREHGIPVKTENYAGKLHSKSMIIDNKYVVIGSMNFSYTANCTNDENLLVIQNSEAALFYKKFFEYMWSRIPDFWLKHDARPESKDSIGSLSDGIDNDYDGKIDEID